jgi:hypothetical protein
MAGDGRWYVCHPGAVEARRLSTLKDELECLFSSAMCCASLNAASSSVVCVSPKNYWIGFRVRLVLHVAR